MIDHEVVSTASGAAERDLERTISELQNRGAQMRHIVGEQR
jgi:hypothetical protein